MMSEEPEQPCKIEDAIIKHAIEKAPEDLQHLLDQRDRQLLESAAKSASIAGIKCLLDRISPGFPAADQVVLEFSAMAGNVDVFRYMVRRHPDPYLGEDLRYYAVAGGVGIWQALLEFEPDCINWPIGLHGDALGLAVQNKDMDLVRFLIQRGINVRASNCMGIPVLQFAKYRGVGEECVSLLADHGAIMDSLQ